MLDLSVRDFLIRLKVIWTLDYATRISIMPGFVPLSGRDRRRSSSKSTNPLLLYAEPCHFPCGEVKLRGKLWGLTGETRGVPPLLVLIAGFRTDIPGL
jgi:hypothetical protein